MRYYCKNCGSTVELGNNSFMEYSAASLRKGKQCPICCYREVEEILDYETPQQYKERTGQPWPDNAPVWIGCGMDGSDYAADRLGNERWALMLYREVKDWVEFDIVCVQSPVPPPDGWKPEEDA